MMRQTRLALGAALVALAAAFVAPSFANTAPTGQPPGQPPAGQPPVAGQPANPPAAIAKLTPEMKQAIRKHLKAQGYARVTKVRLLNREAGKVHHYGPKKIAHAGPVIIATAYAKGGKKFRVFLDAQSGKEIARRRLA
jgi:hypothetical protein